jgi:serine protease Do
MRAIFSVIVWAAALTLAGPAAFSQVSRPSYLGIGVREVTPERAATLNLKELRGAEVAHVDENSPASKAALKQGDVVLEYNGMPVEGVEQFIRMVRETPPGRNVKLVIWRNGATQTVEVTLGERQTAAFPPGVPSNPEIFPGFPNLPNTPIEVPRFQFTWPNSMLGIEGESLGQERQLADYFGVKDGVLIKQVMRNTPAERAGLKAGDVITKVDGQSVASTRDITQQLRSAANRAVTLTVVREKREMPLTVTLNQSNNGRNNAPPEPPGQRF